MSVCLSVCMIFKYYMSDFFIGASVLKHDRYKHHVC